VISIKVYAGFFKDILDIYPSDVVIIVDVLRFSTTVTTALNIGVEEIFVRSDLNEALDLAKKLGIPLVAEVNGFKPSIADLDNSPIEVISYLSSRPPTKIVIRSSWGAPLFEEATKKEYKEIVIGSLVNAKFVVKYLQMINPTSITIAMAGFKERFLAIEDFLGAGAIIDELLKASNNIQLHTDEALIAYKLYVDNKHQLFELISKGYSGKFLIETGRGKDVEFCSKVNSINIVPGAKGQSKVLRILSKVI